MRIRLLLLCSLLLTGCVGLPKGIEPVEGFELDRYLGKWYEIARLDHSFERGLSAVTANYTLREDGGVKVVNRGYVAEDDQWQESTGKAYFAGESNQGFLKVSFFGPFYGSYVVFELDQTDYEYAFIAGDDRSFLWLLARSADVDDELIEQFKTKAAALGFDTDALIFVDHDLPAEDATPIEKPGVTTTVLNNF